jgi:alpha-methylacyl-CoA racemase
MLLSDLGAEVLRIERRGASSAAELDLTTRGRDVIELDLKDEAERKLCRDAIAGADVLIEGFRPGVMERLGLGPAEMLSLNPQLIYGRMTGWGQDGPLAYTAGHDINYIALTGALAALGSPGEPPPPPLNLLGDYGGGALYLAFGIAAALFERDRSGVGQVIDAAIVDGAASLMTVFHGLAQRHPGMIDRGNNPLGGTKANYRCYRCADGRYVAVGALEPQFRAELLSRLGLSHSLSERELEEELATAFASRRRDDWMALFADSDACVAPVLDLTEASNDPHLKARGTYVEVDGIMQPAVAPRFSRTPGRIQRGPPSGAVNAIDRLRSWCGGTG